MKQSLIHLPLERYKQRYTEFLADWEKESFSKTFEVSQLEPPEANVVLDIKTGSVLDSIARPCYAMAQITQLLTGVAAPDLGRIYCSDFYTPGLDALAYSGRRFHASAFLWAQTFDQFDFTARDHMAWMRPWEVMAFEIYDHVFVASSLLADLIITALPAYAHKVHVVGLPFNSDHVLKQWDQSFNKGVGHIDCVYSSRWDKEKDPNFFLDVVETCRDYTFAICTGWPDVRGNDRQAIERLRVLRERGQPNLQVFTGCTKGQYYAVLAESEVQFNCARQDWVSFTLLEALVFGCSPLYPNFRSFPEALMGRQEFMYRPNDLEDACRKLQKLINSPEEEFPAQDVLDYHNHTLDRIAAIIKA
jgi:hypothetical protein